MILTGKAKAHFEKFLHDYLIDNDLQIDRDFFQTSLWNTIIIEFFDSVDIFIQVYRTKCNTYPWQYKVSDISYYGMPNKFETRQEATKQAIIKSNEIHNSL